MLSHCFRHRLHMPAASCLVLLLSVACDRADTSARADSVRTTPESAVVASAPAIDRSGWNRAAGPVLLVQGETRDEAIVLLPSEQDTAAMSALGTLVSSRPTVTLFGRGGKRFTASLGPAAQAPSGEGCRIFPLLGVQGEPDATTWAIGFVGAQVEPLPLDSVDVLSARDSTALVAEASRLASAVTALTSPSFQGLRFTVHDIRRFEAAPGIQAVAAHLMRKVNQEANPQEEHTLLIAERDSGATSGPYTLAFAERAHGLEEQSVTPEVVGGVTLGGRATLVVARDGEAGVAYSMLERVGPRQWRVRWTSAPTRCD